ncbi:MAG: UTP--glucose-1-phosphate uridylyltransferase [Clostridia bacterium]|nr:UTP--glucose-1-phosphate uridylyltransferase [Clostridia bacterium]
MDYSQAKKLLSEHGQTQLLDYYAELSEGERADLICQIASLDFGLLDGIGNTGTRKIGKLSPVQTLGVAEVEKNRAAYYAAGIDALNKGLVAAVLLAGGQGTRLGSDKPKGMFDIGVTRELSIFAQQFENIKQVTANLKTPFDVFVMTSDINDADTRLFFKEKHYFGYPEEKIHFFTQDMSPTCSFDGKIYLEEKGKIFLSPNGNGGWYSSLMGSPAGKAVREGDIKWLNVYSVDNVLQRICDPVFIGATLINGTDCSSKVVKKANAAERVGVLCIEDGKPAIVEYYEMPEDLASATGADGELIFGYGVTLNYLFKVDKLDAILENRLPVHLSKKVIPHIINGEKVHPDEPNGYKLEILVLDMIKLMDSCLAVEVVREREFAPVKNRTGVDSVDTARELLRKNGIII